MIVWLASLLVGAAVAVGWAADIGHERPLLFPRPLRRPRRGHHEPLRVLLAGVRGRAPLAQVGGAERLRAPGRQPAMDGRAHHRTCRTGTARTARARRSSGCGRSARDFEDVAVSFGLRNDGFTPRRRVLGRREDLPAPPGRRQLLHGRGQPPRGQRDRPAQVRRPLRPPRRGKRRARRPAWGSGRTSAGPPSTCRTTRSASRSCARATSCSRRPIRPAPATRFGSRAGSGSAATEPSSTSTGSRCAG